MISKLHSGKYIPRIIPSAAYSDTIFALFGWNTDYKYRIVGTVCEKDNEIVYLFDVDDSETFVKQYLLSGTQDPTDEQIVQPLMASRKLVRAVPAQWAQSFGKQFYIHEKSLEDLDTLTKDDWELCMKGQLYETGRQLDITNFEVLKDYIKVQLGGITPKEVINGRNK